MIEQSREVGLLLALLDEAYDHPSWHGPNLRSSIRGVRAGQAAWRPAPAQTNVWEIVIHAAYWKYAVWNRMTGGKRGSFPYKGSDWFTRPDESSAGESAWKRDVALLDEIHGQLRQEMARLITSDLDRPISNEGDLAWLLRGAAAHDVYHAGQIQTLRRLHRARERVAGTP